MNHLPATLYPKDIKRLAPLISHDKACAAWLRTKPPAKDIARAILVETGDKRRYGILARLKTGWGKAMLRELDEEIGKL